jgi:hypothetical protein
METYTLDGWEAYYEPLPTWGTDEWIDEYVGRSNRYLDDHKEPFA